MYPTVFSICSPLSRLRVTLSVQAGADWAGEVVPLKEPA